MDLVELAPSSALGAWRTLSEAERRRWLSKARARHFALYKAGTPVRGHVFTIDGADIVDLTSFLCAMGEAVNGRGGYFGVSWRAFDDCLFGGFGLEAPCKIVWKNAALSRQKLDSAMLVEYCESTIAEIDQREEPELFEEGRASLAATLALARRGERTFFDEIVDTMEGVPARHLSRPDWVIEVVLE